eukprot:TRINITY_DN50_c0_g1_i7.p2 TRINITY_DN50_c0_g1~~TRINITY_DN50_c0_g1_i7.p2  ORF type:complete len:97 (+),score=11.47 TRINITY_DN50_c0_g1_i7:164-454(+)
MIFDSNKSICNCRNSKFQPKESEKNRCCGKSFPSDKASLPSHDDIKAEKKDRYDSVAGVESFPQDKLKKTDTVVKASLPSHDDIKAEKKKKIDTIV